MVGNPAKRLLIQEQSGIDVLVLKGWGMAPFFVGSEKSFSASITGKLLNIVRILIIWIYSMLKNLMSYLNLRR